MMVIRVFFLIFFFLIDIYANSVPKLLDNNRSIDPLDKNRISNQDTFISPTIQRADISRDKMLLQGDNLYIGWDLKEGKEIWRNIGRKTYKSDSLPYPELLMLQNEDRALVRSSYAGGSEVYFGDLSNAILEIDTKTGLFKVVNLKKSGILRKSHDDTKLLIDNENGSIKVFDLQTLRLLAEYEGGKGRWYWGLKYQPQVFMTLDGKKVFQRGEDSFENIRCIDLDNNNSCGNIEPISGSYSSKLKGITHDGKIVFLEGIVNRENKVIAYDVDDGRILYDLNLSFSKIRNLFISQNDEYLYIFDDDSHLKIISTNDGRIVKTTKMNGVKTIQPIEHTRYLISLEHGILQILDANFKHLVTLQSMIDNEWIIITDEGYFNASSKRVLENLIIADSLDTHRSLTDDEVKKYYRPDIVSALMQNKPIKALLKAKTNFSLIEKAEYKNQYMESLRQMYVRDGNIYVLSTLASPDKPEYLPYIMKAISETNDTEAMDNLYRALGRYEKGLTRDFIIDRIIQTFNKMNDNNTFNNDIYSILRNFKSNEVTEIVTEKLQKTNCLKFENDRYKRKIENDLNITLPCTLN